MSDVSRASLEAISDRLDEVERYLHIDDRRAEVRQLEEQSAQQQRQQQEAPAKRGKKKQQQQRNEQYVPELEAADEAKDR